MMKVCGGCKTEKSVTEFWMDRARGRPKSHCKVCTVASTKAWTTRNPNYERERYQKIKPETRERHLVRKYGITLDAYNAMLAAQNGECAICHTTPDTQRYGVFHVDHCHTTGQVRGLLCRGCNHVLGHLKDDPDALRSAIAYLASPPVPQIPELIGRAILAAEKTHAPSS